MLSKWSNSLALVIALSLISTSSQLVNDPFIDDLMKRMTIEDKCGQMTQITLDTITRCKPECIYQTSDGFPGGCTCPVYDDSNPINVTKLNEAIGTFRVGSILNTAYDRAQKASIWQDIIKQLQDTAMKNPVKIPILYGLDSIHGANYIQEATLFPQPIAMAASFNLDIAEQVGAITSMETRAAGVPWNFNPVLDIGRQFLWPRLVFNFVF
jgi:beta-glucosidase